MCPSPQEPLGANEVSLKVMAKLCVLVSPQSVLRSKSRCVCARSLTSSGPPVVLVLSWLCTDTFVGDCLAFLDASAPVCRCDAGMSVWAGVYGVENAPLPSSVSFDHHQRPKWHNLCSEFQSHWRARPFSI